MGFRAMIRTVACTLLVGLACGCSDMKLPLSYTAAPQPKLGDGPVLIARAAEPGMDKSKDGLFILGAVRNGYGMQTSNVVARDSIAGWITDACQTQFGQAGYQPQTIPQLPDACPRGLQIDIDRISSDMDPGMFTIGGISKVEFVLTVVRDGKPVEKIRFEGIADDRGVIGGGGELEKALKKALQNCMKEATQYATAAWKEQP